MSAIVLSIKIIRYHIPLDSGEGYEKISQERATGVYQNAL